MAPGAKSGISPLTSARPKARTRKSAGQVGDTGFTTRPTTGSRKATMVGEIRKCGRIKREEEKSGSPNVSVKYTVIQVAH